MRAVFPLYAVLGPACLLAYRVLEPIPAEARRANHAPLGPSRGIVVKLAALFSVDNFAGGLAVQALLALWLFGRFDLSLAQAGLFFVWSGVLSAFSFPVAALLAGRIGLINTMVFTHIPSSLCLIAAMFAPGVEWAPGLLLLRAALSQMDVPTRTSDVMAVVTPPERNATASFTAVPRSLAAAAGPRSRARSSRRGGRRPRSPSAACSRLPVTSPCSGPSATSAHRRSARRGSLRDGQARGANATRPIVSKSAARRIRMLLASLMLLTGMLGQAGHAWAHGGAADPAAAWLAAMQAERDWLAGDGGDASVQVFGAEGRHSHGNGPAHQHDGPDGLLADHAHGVAFLLPAASGLAHRDLDASLTCALSARLAGTPCGNLDRPPRGDAALV